MIAIVKPRSRKKLSAAEQNKFLAMMPRIRAAARHAFRAVNAEAREDLENEVIAGAFSAFHRLIERGKGDLAFASPLARYAIRHIRAGRRVGSKLNIRDLDYVRQVHGVVVERLNSNFGDLVVESRTVGPAATAAARIDLAAWLGSLRRRQRCVALALGRGERTGDIARMLKISPARISQLRRELQRSWAEFQNEPLND